MKFNIHVAYRDVKGEPWIEDYNRSEISTEDEAREWAKRVDEAFTGMEHA